ncbi:MAG TPA: RHS repeat-associated core domain-containing protein, partial [Terriglobales bacterium]|nr:RHS repeat-associated core domain-containing protein [Terriglobales bacterium]
AMPYAAGRLAEAYTGARATDIGLGYDLMGRPGVVYETTPAMGGGWSQTGETYFPNGAAATVQIDTLTASYTVDGEGRALSASLGGTTLASGAGYDTAGQPTGIALGTAASDAYYYDAATGRMTEYKFTVGAGVDDGLLGWNANGSLASLAISDSVPGTADTQTCTYGRDDLARLASVSCGTVWAQTFTLDRLGNLRKEPGSSQAFSALYGANNRIASNGSVFPNYDSNGNLLDDPVTGSTNVNAFDAEGHMVKLEGISVTFDALGRMAEAAEPGGAIEIVYGPGGGKLGVMGGGNLLRGEFPLPGGAEAVYSAATLQYFVHSDNLGSARLATTPSGGVYSSNAYAPYGETYAQTGAYNRDFTGQRQDIIGGQYDFLMRELSQVQGRWWTPDPAGLAAVDPTDPQTWNRYAYVGGRPLSAVDLLGMVAFEGGCIPVVKNDLPSKGTANADADSEEGPYDPGPDDDGYSGCANSGPCTSYILDGSAMGCNPIGGAALGSGSAAQCPDNFCEGAAWSADGKSAGFVQFVATDGDASGYYKAGDLNSGIHDYNGQIYSDKGWHQEGNYLAFWGGQCMAVGNAVAASAAGGKIQGCNQTEGLHGGHENYALSCPSGCTAGRYAAGLHVECAPGSTSSCWAHMDTASPYLGSTFNPFSIKSWESLDSGALLAHFAVDVIGGNLGVYAFGH